MVDKQVVLETIKKMYESGIDDSVVEQTLKDIGLASEEIAQYVAEAKGEQVQQPPIQSPKQAPVLRHDAGQGQEQQDAMHTTTHAALESQANQTTELLQKVSSLEKTIQSNKSGTISASSAELNQRIGKMEIQLTDLKAQVNATKSIMEKILETDRKVLNKL